MTDPILTNEATGIESITFGDFLSDDPRKVASSAIELGPYFVALAGASIEVRRAVGEEWRAKQVADAIALPGWLAESFHLLPPEYREAATAGKVGIEEFKEAARQASQKYLDERRISRMSGKARIREHLTSMHLGDHVRQSAIPRAAVVLESGELSWHGSEQEARKHGRESGMGCVVMPIDWGRTRFFQKSDSLTGEEAPSEDIDDEAETGATDETAAS